MKNLLAILLFVTLCMTEVFAFKQIEIITIGKPNNYVEVTVTMRFALPAILKDSLGNKLKNANTIISTYGNFTVDSISTSPTWVVTRTETVPLSASTLAQFKAGLIAKWTAINTQLNAIILKPYDTLAGYYYDGTNWIAP